MWSKQHHALQKYVDACLNTGKHCELPTPPPPEELVPNKTVIRKCANSMSAHEKDAGHLLTAKEFIKVFNKTGGKARPLAIEQRKRVNKIMVRRDSRNFPVGRKDVLNLIAHVSRKSFKAAENHCDHIIRNKLLTELKRGGRAVSAQKTTAKRSQVTIQKQLRWHQTIDLAWETQAEKNEPKEEFKKLKAHFHGNMDETCILGSEGTLKVTSSIFKKTETNKCDFRGSVAMICTGTAAGGHGPVIFLCKGEKELIPPSLRGDLSEKHGLPVGSCVIATPDAFLTDDAWLELVSVLCKGIRQMPVVKDNPDWDFVLTLDGFVSHMAPAALEIFLKCNIMSVLEDGDSSDTSQPHDQLKAKEDKQACRDLLDMKQASSKQQLDQWDLITICAIAVSRSKADAWISSFKRVNLHPDHRLDFEQWLDRIGSKIVAGEKFFKRRHTLHDMLPQFWKQMSVEDRRLAVEQIDRHHANKSVETWSKQNLMVRLQSALIVTPFVWTDVNHLNDAVKEVVEFVPLKDISRLRACHLTAKRDPSVLKTTTDELDQENEDQG